MWIDTHIHLDDVQYSGEQTALLDLAREKQVRQWVIPAVSPANFDAVRQLAHATHGAVYALGIHPMYVDHCTDQALELLEQVLKSSYQDPKLVAIGEIGLDYFVPGQDIAKQQRFFIAQLRLAARYDLPVLLHVRKSQDHIAKYIRQYPVVSGIAHAFNGSAQQAQVLIDLGLCLGFGGAATYARALQIRRHLVDVPDHAIVLETDGPDIAPYWLAGKTNPPDALARIGHELAAIKGMSPDQFADLCGVNTRRVLPKMAPLACD